MGGAFLVLQLCFMAKSTENKKEKKITKSHGLTATSHPGQSERSGACRVTVYTVF